MRDGYVIIRTFTSEIEAELARSQLVALGLKTELESDNCGGMRPHFDLTRGIRLLVPESDAPYARDLLVENASETLSPAWRCDPCQEDIEAGFDVCWKCGRAHP